MNIVSEALLNYLLWKTRFGVRNSLEEFYALRVVELQDFILFLMAMLGAIVAAGKFHTLPDLDELWITSVHLHWREHWRNIKTETIPVLLRGAAFPCSSSHLFWDCSSVWIPAHVSSVPALLLTHSICEFALICSSYMMIWLKPSPLSFFISNWPEGGKCSSTLRSSRK